MTSRTEEGIADFVVSSLLVVELECHRQPSSDQVDSMMLVFILLCSFFAARAVYPTVFSHAWSVVCVSVKEALDSGFDLRLEAAFLQPLLVEFWDVLYTYGRTVYILCAMCLGYLCARFGMGHVELPIYIVGVLCHEQHGWVILVSDGN